MEHLKISQVFLELVSCYLCKIVSGGGGYLFFWYKPSLAANRAYVSIKGLQLNLSSWNSVSLVNSSRTLTPIPNTITEPPPAYKTSCWQPACRAFYCIFHTRTLLAVRKSWKMNSSDQVSVFKGPMAIWPRLCAITDHMVSHVGWWLWKPMKCSVMTDSLSCTSTELGHDLMQCSALLGGQ